MKLNWKTLVKIGISVFLLYLCIYYWPAVSTLLAGIVGAAAPLLIGCVIAYPVNILMTTYEKIFFPKTQKREISTCCIHIITGIFPFVKTFLKTFFNF